MKRITRTTERTWQCPYCGFLNDLQNNTCEKCGAVRNGNEVEKEITTDFTETTTTTEVDQPSDYVITTHASIRTILLIVGALAVIAIIAIFLSNRSTPINFNDENYAVVSKEWEYTVNIGEFVEEKDITSYTAPPVGAENIRTRQVQQSNGWYKTEYIYDYADWKVTKTETITGSKDIPTYKEYIPADDQKVMGYTTARFTVTVMTPTYGRQVFTVSEAKWKTFTVDKTYPASEFK